MAQSPPSTLFFAAHQNDGTTSMQRGYRGHAISIGLVRADEPVLGVVCGVDATDDVSLVSIEPT